MNLAEKQRKYYDSGITRQYEFRLGTLKKLSEIVTKNEKEIIAALNKDLGKSEAEAYLTEVSVVLSELKNATKNLKSWMKPTEVSSPLHIFHSVSKIYPESLGVTLIISPWNYPFQLTFAPLIASIAAGNTAVLKPSEFSPATSEVIKKILSENFDEEYIAVVLGAAKASEELLAQKFDKIFFTGSTNVGKIVMQAAAKNLTPVTLELGGKSPCVVEETVDISLSAKKIIWGKLLNAGQTCVAPDYILVQENIKKTFMEELVKNIHKLYGENILENEEYPKIIDEKHFERALSLIDKDKIYYGGKSDKSKLKIEPTIIDEPELSSKLMSEEIFAPIIPIISYKTFNDAKRIILSYPKPLAFYLFSNIDEIKSRAINEISFGGATINDVLIHLTNENLPFGGVGSSGMGRYHGKFGFEEFSHYKSVLEKSKFFDIFLRYPPLKNKLAILKKIV